MAWFGYNKNKGVAQMAVQLPVTFIEEGDSVIAYTPALDLSTCGSTREEAKQMFDEIVKIFFKDLVENNRTEDVLSSLGWTRKDQAAQWMPPKISQESIGVQVAVPA